MKLDMTTEILSPTDDRIFKVLLTHPDGKAVLIDVVSSVLDRKVIDVQVRNNEVPLSDINEKQEKFDVNCVVDTGEQCNLEMQASAIEEKAGDSHKNLKNKSVYYLTDLHSSQSSKGKAYNELVRTYQVTFCTYTVFPKRVPFLNTATLRCEDGFQLSDAINLVFIELSKLKEVLEKPVSDMTSLEMWALFFRYVDNPECRGKINDILSVKEAMGTATKLLTSISQDERERAIYRSRRMYQTDMESNLRTAELRGELRGKLQGELQGVIKVATNMKLKGKSIEEISDLTGLSTSEINDIEI